MANHLTPTELAQYSGLDRRSVIELCMQRGIPIYQGKIDKALFQAVLNEARASERQPAHA